MSHFVLVHGAWHGGWCWDRVRPHLLAAGHRVSTPTLAGLGGRRDELSAQLSLAHHVDDVVGAIAAEGTGADDEDEVVLVGHSYAGIVVREAADRRPDRVARLVLLDAWVGGDGDSMLSIAPEWFASAVMQAAHDTGDGWTIPAPPPSLVGVDDPADGAWLDAHLTPHPLRTFSDPTTLGGAVDAVPTAAIVCARQSGIPFAGWAEDRGWPVETIESGHDVMVTNPVELARALAAQVPPS
jgi:pimeloyl-ACP methyl ester carboxylesterase